LSASAWHMYHLACSVTFKLACSVTFDEQVLYLFQQDMVTIVATSFHTCILHYKMSHRPPAITIQRFNVSAITIQRFSVLRKKQG
jgi:hypothetical protein